jgi:DNA-binding XRE family transcriptional regulator
MQQEATTGNNLPTGSTCRQIETGPDQPLRVVSLRFYSRGLRHFTSFRIVSPVQASGPLIRRKREESGLSLTEFANSIGISASNLSRIERDQVKPGPLMVRRIAEGFERERERRIRAVIAEITDAETEAPHDQPPG